METEKFLSLLDYLEDMNDEQTKWIFANLNHIIEKYNEKFKENITVRF